ncbi:MAG TPA: hypothetical protein VG164_03540 [Trebonia sp.]|nr:hypothetical protein [Trebonia sp.]
MLINTLLSVPVTSGGAASVGVGCPQPVPTSGAGHIYVPASIPGSAFAAAAPAAVFAVSRRVPAMTRPLAVKAELPLVDNRNQYVHMTRVNAGGEGALGPHPEREPA